METKIKTSVDTQSETSDFRLRFPSLAFRAMKPEFLPSVSSPAAHRGLVFERNVKRQLEFHLARHKYENLEHNPWFSYITERKGESKRENQEPSVCSPDFLIHFPDKIFIVETKLTWTSGARLKLDLLYRPVVAKALGKPTEGFVICRYLTPGAPKPVFTLSEIFASPDPQVLHWNTTKRLGW